MIPAAAIASIAPSWMEPLSSPNEPPGSSADPAIGVAASIPTANTTIKKLLDTPLGRIAFPFHWTLGIAGA